MFDQLKTLLQENDFLQGGVILGVVAGMWRYLLRLPFAILHKIERYAILSVEFDKTDNLFQHFVEWVDKSGLAQKKNQLRVSTKVVDEDDNENDDLEHLIGGNSSATKSRPIFSLAQGRFWVYSGFWFTIMREKTDTGGDKPQTDILAMMNMERITICTLWYNRTRLLNLISEVYKVGESNPDTIWIKRFKYSDWGIIKKQTKTSLDNVILREGQREELQADIEKFFASEKWYREKNIPFRRTYLLSGPPGTGKSTLVTALCSHYNKSLGIIDLTKASDELLQDALGCANSDTIVLIEDLHGLFKGRENLKKKESNLTFSGLLNAIDGVISSEGRILFITTNDTSTLDSALTRKGRVDKHYILGYADRSQYRRLFLKFYPDKESIVDEWVKANFSPETPPSAIQDQLISMND